MEKIVKNISASPYQIVDVGVTIPASSSYTVPDQDYLLWSASRNFIQGVTGGILLANDGYADFGVSGSINFMDYPDRAINQRFYDNSIRGNGFTSKTTQEAIEEAKNTAEGKMRYLASCGFDGNASSGRYLEYNSNVDSNQSGFVLAVASILKELSIAVQSSSTVTFSVYNWNGTTETLLTSISLSSARTGRVTGLSVSLAALSEIRIKCTSGSCSRPIVFQYFQVS